MGITTVTATAHEVLSTVTGRDRTHVLPVIRATVETDEGVTGHGLVHGVFGLEAICTQINHALAAENEGLNPLETDRIWDAIDPRRLTGTNSVAVSTVDIAL